MLTHPYVYQMCMEAIFDCKQPHDLKAHTQINEQSRVTLASKQIRTRR